MKQSNLHLVIILAALITAIVVAGILLIVFSVTGNQSAVTDEPVETVATTTAAKKPSSSVPPSTSIQPSPINPASTTTATPPSTTPPQSPTNPPASNPTTPIPTPTGTVVAGDKVGSLQIFASYDTIEESAESGKAKIRVTFYLESYALNIGVRTDNYLVVDGVRTENLQSPIISLPNGSPQTRTVLYQYTCEVDRNSPPTIEFYWHFQGRYSGESVEWLSVAITPSI